MNEQINNLFAELPSALVNEVLQSTEGLSQALLEGFEKVHEQRERWRKKLMNLGILRRESELPYMPIPTTCGVDGSYAIEHLLTSDLVAAAAVAVEGLTPPSETRYWPEPRHKVLVEMEVHDSGTGTILRAFMIGMELELASNAPHELVFIDGSLTTPLIYFNQAMIKAIEAQQLKITQYLTTGIVRFLQAYRVILSSVRTDRAWVAIPKYTTRREIGKIIDWPETYDDRGLLSFLLEPGEFTQPQVLQEPQQPWHLNTETVAFEEREKASRLSEEIIDLLTNIQVIYYRPYSWLPALRLEASRTVVENPARLALMLHGIKHQCGAAAIMEPFPLYMADRMVKHLPKSIPAFRQITSQRLAETYHGNVTEVFMGLHGYRTEWGF